MIMLKVYPLEDYLSLKPRSTIVPILKVLVDRKTYDSTANWLFGLSWCRPIRRNGSLPSFIIST
jgi:hypothetical protein